MIKRLDMLHKGESGRVRAVNTEGGMRRRFMDMGITAGTRIECVGVSPLGDPKAFSVRGAVVAIRKEDSAGIDIEV